MYKEPPDCMETAVGHSMNHLNNATAFLYEDHLSTETTLEGCTVLQDTGLYSRAKGYSQHPSPTHHFTPTDLVYNGLPSSH